MIKTRSKIQSQVLNPPKSSTEDTNMEENRNHADEISELVTSEVDRQVQKDMEQLRSEISELRKEIHEVKKQMEKRIEETRSEITSELKKEILEVKKQMEKRIEEMRAEKKI